MKKTTVLFFLTFSLVFMIFQITSEAEDPYTSRLNLVRPGMKVVNIIPYPLSTPLSTIVEVYSPSGNFNFWTLITNDGNIHLIPGTVGFKFEFGRK